MLRDSPEVALLFSDLVLGTGATGVELARAALAERPRLRALMTSGYERATEDDDAPFALLRKSYRLR